MLISYRFQSVYGKWSLILPIVSTIPWSVTANMSAADSLNLTCYFQRCSEKEKLIWSHIGLKIRVITNFMQTFFCCFFSHWIMEPPFWSVGVTFRLGCTNTSWHFVKLTFGMGALQNGSPSEWDAVQIPMHDRHANYVSPCSWVISQWYQDSSIKRLLSFKFKYLRKMLRHCRLVPVLLPDGDLRDYSCDSTSTLNCRVSDIKLLLRVSKIPWFFFSLSSSLTFITSSFFFFLNWTFNRNRK